MRALAIVIGLSLLCVAPTALAEGEGEQQCGGTPGQSCTHEAGGTCVTIVYTVPPQAYVYPC